MRVESGDIRYPHFSGDNQTDFTRPFFLPRKKRPGPEATVLVDQWGGGGGGGGTTRGTIAAVTPACKLSVFYLHDVI